MRKSAIAAFAIMSMMSYAFADDETTAAPSLRKIVDEIEANGSAIVHNENSTVRLVRDRSQCALGEQLVPIWINFADVRQHLTGYTCQPIID
jgi:hypothetical protein